MTMAPLVSVVMPTRNRCPLLERAIASVTAQTFEDFELIIVDDASTDGTTELLATQRARDTRIRPIRLDRPAGGAAARNRGAAAARGAWIAFIDDDDEWFARKLEVQLAAAREQDGGVIYCPTRFVAADGSESVLPCGGIPASGARRALLRRNFISTPTVVVARDVLARVGGFDERLPRLQDWDLWIRLADAAHFTFVPDPLVRAYHTAGGISTSSTALVDACRILEDKFRDSNFDRSERSDFYHALGHILMIGGAAGQAPPYLWRSVRARPTPVRAAMALLSTLGPQTYRAVARTHERWARRRTGFVHEGARS